jgi:glycosyltransferase involved in cell wall biosynthesis
MMKKTRVLMFGWEFPPHITGGLGTACHGLTGGLSELGQTEVIFVVPKVFGDEKPENVKLLGANKVAVSKKEVEFFENSEKMEVVEIDSPLVPYLSEEDFWTFKSKKYTKQTRFIQTNKGYEVDFQGGYSGGLFDEIKKYALVAEVVASEQHFNVIHAHDWLTFPAAIAAKKVSGKPLVVHVHATEFDRTGENVNTRIYSIEREGMENADHIIAVSGLTKKTIIEKYGIQASRVSVVYNAVEPVEGPTPVKPKKVVKDKIITFLGRITFQKGPEYFIEAAALVLKKMRNVRFVMAGSGDLLNTMVLRVAELGIADRFHFTGFLSSDDVHQLLKMTDVFVMPSVSEPFGIVPLEAMQFNVPVIISHQSGVSEILEHAIKIDFLDTLAMADAIYGLLNYNALARHFKAEGKHEVDGLEWTHAARQVAGIYRMLLNLNS